MEDSVRSTSGLAPSGDLKDRAASYIGVSIGIAQLEY